jgi:hypothetical protein
MDSPEYTPRHSNLDDLLAEYRKLNEKCDDILITITNKKNAKRKRRNSIMEE